MINFRKFTIGLLLLSGVIFCSTTSFAQEEKNDDGDKPVRRPWTGSILIDHQTTEGPSKGMFLFKIHHRFSKINEIDDLYGIYGASNIRIGVNYGITKNISVGFGTEKNRKLQEFQGKYKILTQTKNNKIPVTVSYFGNVVIDGREKETFGDNYEFLNRLSFLNQIIIGRKITKAFSAQVAATYVHYNAVTDLVERQDGAIIGKWKNDYLGAMIGMRYKFYNQMSAIVEYSQPFALEETWEGQSEPKPNLGIGVEFGTGTHAFQVFAANYYGIVGQENYAHNLDDMTDGGWRFGFNITARF